MYSTCTLSVLCITCGVIFCVFDLLQPFKSQLAETTEPDKRQMLERLDAAVTAALGPLQGAMQDGATDAVIQNHAQVGRCWTSMVRHR